MIGWRKKRIWGRGDDCPRRGKSVHCGESIRRMRDGCLAVEEIGRVMEVDSIVWSDIRHLKVVKHFSVKVRGQLEAC